MRLAAARRFVLDTLFMRCFSFALNQIIVRIAKPGTIGVAAIQLELFLSSLLFLTREAIRLALLRTNLTSKVKLQQMVNISWIPAAILLLLLIATFFSSSFYWSESISSLTIRLYVLGAFLELCGEPFFNIFNNKLVLRPRVLAESIAITLKSLTTCLLLFFFHYEVSAFGIAQVIYGAAYVCTLAACSCLLNDCKRISCNGTIIDFVDYFPSFLSSLKGPTTTSLHPNTSSKSSKAVAAPVSSPSLYDIMVHQVGAENIANVFATGPFYLLKHVLTEGDKIMMTSLRSSYDQGVYAVLNNYVSLIARLVFYPIEESSRIAFAQCASQIKVEKSSLEASRLLQQQYLLLSRLVMSLSLLGCLFPTFGVHYSRLAVKLFLARQYQQEETVSTLQAFCSYILVLGLNGITEAYLHSIMPSSQFTAVNMNLVYSSILFLTVVAPLNALLGTAGVVYANSLSMLLRLMLNYQLIHRSFSQPNLIFQRPMEGLPNLAVTSIFKNGDVFLPKIIDFISPATICTLVVTQLLVFASATRYSRSGMKGVDALQHVSIGLLCLASFAYSVWQHHALELRAIVTSISTDVKQKDS